MNGKSTESPQDPISTPPRVSIGLPVFNGENYLATALDSLLAQTHTDFELIISDNGSTDATPTICRQYAARDKRILYHRTDVNRGASWNFNHLIDLARGDFFMWASHDDVWAPRFIERAIDALEAHPECILCYSPCRQIDGEGNIYRSIPAKPALSSLRPSIRFAGAWRYLPQMIVFGLIRTDAIRKTRGIGAFSGSDRVLASELMLLGPAQSLDEYLFFYRKHEEQSTGHRFPDSYRRLSWFDPGKRGSKSFPHWRVLKEHAVAIRSSTLSATEKLLCYLSVLRKGVRVRRQLFADVSTYLSSRPPARSKPITR